MRGVRSVLVALAATVTLIGCSGSEEQPVQGDNPASVNAVSAPPDVQNSRAAGGPPRNTLPPGQGRSGGGTAGADGMSTR